MTTTLCPIKGYGGFQAAFESGRRFHAKNLTAAVVFQPLAGPPANVIHYGVAIGKKTAKKAVVRNRVKRLLRASLRLLLAEFGWERLCVISSVVLIYKWAPARPGQICLSDVLPAVRAAMQAATVFGRRRLIKTDFNSDH